MRSAAAVLLVLPFLSGCQAIVAVFDADFEPVFTPALWEGSRSHDLVTTTRWVAGPEPIELQRAARTGGGVWHVETRFSDGVVRHHTWDPGHPGLRQGDRAMESWVASDYYGQEGSLLLAAEPWPAAALPLPVLSRPGGELPDGPWLEPLAPLPPDEEAVRALFADLGEACGVGTVLRLDQARTAVQVILPEGGWQTLARYPSGGHTEYVDRPRPHRPFAARAAEGTIKMVLTPPAVALDAGWLGVLGTAKVVAVVAVAPLIFPLLLFSRGWGGC